MFTFRTFLLTIAFCLASQSSVEAGAVSTCEICKRKTSYCQSYRLRNDLGLENELNNIILLSILNDPEMKHISKEDTEEIRQCDLYHRQWSRERMKEHLRVEKLFYKQNSLSTEDNETPAEDLILKDTATIIRERQRHSQNYPQADWNVKAIIKLFLALKTLRPSEGIWLLSRLEVHHLQIRQAIDDAFLELQALSELKGTFNLRPRPLNIIDPPYESIATEKSSELFLAFPAEVMHIICTFLNSKDLISLASANKRMQEFAIGPINQRLHWIRNKILHLDYHTEWPFRFRGAREGKECPSALQVLITRAKALEEVIPTPGTLRANHSPDSSLDEEK